MYPATQWLNRVLDMLAAIQVPHQWFIHFYVVSVASSIFWAIQILTQGSWLKDFQRGLGSKSSERSMSMNQVVFAWSLMMVQGVRRLAESVMTAKTSASKMSVAHWLLGIAFYLAVNIAIWIEGLGMSHLRKTNIYWYCTLWNEQCFHAVYMTWIVAQILVRIDTILSTEQVHQSIILSAPSVRTMLSLPIFILASGLQHDCHLYLASLPKYTLPSQPIFQILVCPHYTAECFIYLSLAILTAPEGALLNSTVFAAFLFVSVNLTVTASITKEWYERKYGKDSVAHRWRMIPFLF